MNFNFFKDIITKFLGFIVAVLIHGAIPFSIDLLFHSFNLYIQFTILIIFTILLHNLFNILKINFIKKKKIWAFSYILSLIFAIITTLLLFTFSFKNVGSAKCGIYFKGDKFTSKAIELKLEKGCNDDWLAESVNCNVNLVWIDSENKKTVFIWLLFVGVLLYDFCWCCHLQLKKFERKK
ncbi:MAG: hypothetical protein A2033_18820 [Bacteroidetes bacterium GWA2_31_9]|nr:MAG: hypothetical protein A2033_18820 [Bacteroidetes bacterium GWA2_31_9]